MDKKTVASISFAKSFNKKWWDSNRSSKIKGTGTGALLDVWAKACPPAVEKMSGDQIKSAKAACEKLETSFHNAAKMCGKTEQDDADGIKKLLGLLETYQHLLGEREKAISTLAQSVKDTLDIYNQAKPELGTFAKDLGTLRDQYAVLEKQSLKSMSETEKGELVQGLKKLVSGADELSKGCEKLGLRVKNAEKLKDKELKLARADRGFAPDMKKFDVSVEGFDKISDKLHDDVKSLELDLLELIKDVSGSETINSTLERLENQEVYLSSPTFGAYGDIVDKAKVWLPKIVTARKSPDKVAEKDWNDFVGLKGEIVAGIRQSEAADSQIGRLLKISAKSAARFKDNPRVQQKMKDIQSGAKVLMTERAQMQKAYPVLLQQLDELLKVQP